MKKLAVITKHTKAGFYIPEISVLPFNNIDDAVQALNRDAKMADSVKLIKVKDFEQYAIGFFDDITGKLDLFANAEFLIEYGSYFSAAVERESIKNE